MNAENRLFVIEKAISCFVALLIVIAFSPVHVLDVVVVLGHAHFALTYFYQYKAGKVKGRYLFLYLIGLAVFFYISFSYFIAFTVFVATFFLFHNFFDEFKLRQEKPSVEYLAIILLLVAILSGWTADYFSRGSNITNLLIVGAVGVSTLLLLVKGIIGQLHLDLKSPYMIFLIGMALLFLTLEYTGNRPDARESFGFVILLHYFAWYIRLGVRFFKQDKENFKTYLKRIVIVNAIFMVGYYIIVVEMERQGASYQYTYRPLAFYVWTLMHLITTFRISDYKSAFNFSKISA